jgi:hypothetical protein
MNSRMRSTGEIRTSSRPTDEHCVNTDLEGKVELLENALSTLRAEVDLKMGIMEKILTTRNGL